MKKMLKKLTLSPAEQSALDELIGEIRKLWPKTKFKLFGSRVTGIADAESDLDLLIQLPFPVTEEIRRQIIHKTFDLNLAYESNISVLIVSRFHRPLPDRTSTTSEAVRGDFFQSTSMSSHSASEILGRFLMLTSFILHL